MVNDWEAKEMWVLGKGKCGRTAEEAVEQQSLEVAKAAMKLIAAMESAESETKRQKGRRTQPVKQHLQEEKHH